MPTKNETWQVVYIHPKGCYAVIERRGKGIWGEEYCIRETIYPPFPWQKNKPKLKPEPKPQPVQKKTAVPVTEEEKALFAKLYRQGRTVDEIAAISNRSKTTVFKYLNLMELIRRQKKLTDSEKAQIITMGREGVTGAKIAETLGISEKTVYRELHAVGIWKNQTTTGSRKRGAIVKADYDKLELALARACMMPYQVARKAGISLTTMHNIRSGWNVKPVTLGRVARALGVDVTEIMQQEG